MALLWLRTSYHAQRYMFQRYMLRSLLTQSFNIVNTPIILLFSKKWVPGFAAEDNMIQVISHDNYLTTSAVSITDPSYNEPQSSFILFHISTHAQLEQWFLRN